MKFSPLYQEQRFAIQFKVTQALKESDKPLTVFGLVEEAITPLNFTRWALIELMHKKIVKPGIPRINAHLTFKYDKS